MDAAASDKHMSIHVSQFLVSFKNQQNNNISVAHLTPMGTVSENGFPIIGVAMLGIMAIGFLLVSYYIFVTKCCINWQQFDPLRRFFNTRPRPYEDPLMAYTPSRESRGLDELVIREIPTFPYSKNRVGERSFRRCVVCLNEFKEDEMLRLLPKCSHAFHLDCIDIWLQNNASCPLCRTSISGTTTKHPIDMIVAPNSSPQDPHIPLLRRRSEMLGSEEDFVVIELSGELGTEAQNRSNSISRSTDSSSKFEQGIGKSEKEQTRKYSMMGDECINVRDKDALFSVEPIRRSFSMDSAADRHVYLSVQQMIRHNRQLISEMRNNGESSSRSIRKSIFSFGHRRSKTSVLPFES